MYERILDADWIKVDYYNDGKPVIRVSEFIKGKWHEFYCDLPANVESVAHAHWVAVHDRGNNWSRCSRCNTVGSPFWNRCPVCEAKMDEILEVVE